MQIQYSIVIIPKLLELVLDNHRFVWGLVFQTLGHTHLHMGELAWSHRQIPATQNCSPISNELHRSPQPLINCCLVIWWRESEQWLVKKVLLPGGLLTWRAIHDLPWKPLESVEQQSIRLHRRTAAQNNSSTAPLWSNCGRVSVDWTRDYSYLADCWLGVACTTFQCNHIKTCRTIQLNAPQPANPHQLPPSVTIECEWVSIGQEITRTWWIIDLEWLARLATTARPKHVELASRVPPNLQTHINGFLVIHLSVNECWLAKKLLVPGRLWTRNGLHDLPLQPHQNL